MTRLSEIFEQGIVYADKWAPDVRLALDVPDPLTDIIANGLRSGRRVVISGNAGDGKSHLAQQALGLLPSRSCLEITVDTDITPDRVAGQVIFVRDASALPDSILHKVVDLATQYDLPMLMTINEGPIAKLAGSTGSAFFLALKDVLHARAQGEDREDPNGTLLINLAGRQLARSAFGQSVLDLLLPHVTPCSSCGKPKSKTCPRVHGATLLKKSRRARDRMCHLLSLYASGGNHLTARDIWVFFIDLFFGHTCTPQDPRSNSSGYFWNRIFDDETSLCEALRTNFDPIQIPLPNADSALWLGDFDSESFGIAFPGDSPVDAYRRSDIEGMEAFTSAKRAYYLFSKSVDPDSVAMQISDAPNFRNLLESSFRDSRGVLREVVSLLNRYRLETRIETELWISRHHGMAAHKRPGALAASSKSPLDSLNLLVPHEYDSRTYPESGYFPDALLLQWKGSSAVFTLDFYTWSELQRRRTLTVDRDQETLDFAIDIFMGQARIKAEADPEIKVYDHKSRRTYQIRARHNERGFEVLT